LSNGEFGKGAILWHTGCVETIYVTDPVYLEHDQHSHPENAERLRRILLLLEQEGMTERLRLLPPRPATLDELHAVHTPSLVNLIRRIAQNGGGYVDSDTYLTSRSYDVAVLAAGGALRAVESVLSGEAANGYALVRPPGHHATPTRAMGFCLFNNVAVATRAALRGGLAKRVFIADFDVHHGNGTQEAFAGEPAVFYFSLHQYPLYPGTGHARETGYGPGEGTVLNVPLPPGTGDRAVQRVITELVWPLAERFAPDLLLVSAGYDAHWSDPLAQMALSLTGYAWLQRELVSIARALCSGRIVFVLEGGYQLDVLAYGVLNAFCALTDTEAVHDPLGPAPREGPTIDHLLAQLKTLHHLS
jgi:acetoin utilization deacetylase AcuC-like enzyme